MKSEEIAKIKADILKALKIYGYKGGDVVEVRALKYRTGTMGKPTTASGFFDNMEKLAEEVAKVEDKAGGWYITKNQLKHDLISLRYNRIEAYLKDTDCATNNDAINRDRLILDLDPHRMSGIPSTDVELKASLDKAEAVKAWLRGQGWPEPATVLSGNGAALIYRIDLPVEDGGLEDRVLKTIRMLMGDLTKEQIIDKAPIPEDGKIRVDIDPSVGNLGRITRLPGTYNRKGDSTPERPHRRAAILTHPEVLEAVPREKLEAIAKQYDQLYPPKQALVPAERKARNTRINVDRIESRFGLKASHRKSVGGGEMITYEQCPNNPHHERSFSIIKKDDGGAVAICFHNSCGANTDFMTDLIKQCPECVEKLETKPKIAVAEEKAVKAGPEEDIIADTISEEDQHIHELAMEILTKKDPLQFIADTVKELHKGDEDACKMLVLSEIDIYVENTHGFQPGLHGGSGKGKTDLAKKVKHISPQDKFIESSVSGKALYYLAEAGRLHMGTVVLCDDMNLNDAVRETLKRCSTNFTETTVHNTVDKGEVKTMVIPPRIVWWLTSVDADDDDQILNREIPLSVDETEATDEKVFEQQCEEFRTGQIAMPETEDVLVCREIIRIVTNKRRTVICTFATPNRIEWDGKDNRRNFAIFSDVVKSVTLLNRFKQGHGDPDADTIEVTEDDFEQAAAIYCAQGESQKTKLTDQELGVLRFLGSRVNGATINEIQAHIGKSYGRTYKLLHGKGPGQGGLLLKVKALRYEPETISEELDGGSTRRTKPRNKYILDTTIYKPLEKLYGKVVTLNAAK